MALNQALAVPEHYRRKFEDTWGHVVQQDRKKLANRVTMRNFTGKEKVFTDLDELTVVPRGRRQQSSPVEAEGLKRKMTKEEFKVQVIFDQSDDEFLAEMGQPNSEVIEAMRMAWWKSNDTAIGTSFDATVYGGVDPYVTAIDLPSTQKVAVNYVDSGSPANSGLTPEKIIKAVNILEENEIDPMEEEVCIALNPKCKLDLLAYTRDASNDIWAAMISAWLEGRDNKLFGLTPVMSNRLYNDVSTDIDTVAVYSKPRGIYFAEDDLEIKMDILPTEDHALQISGYGRRAVMRKYEKGVVTIACDRTP